MAAGAAVVVLLAACGGGSASSTGSADATAQGATSQSATAQSESASGSAAAVDACAALTPDQVAAVLGSPAAGQPQNSASEAYGLSACTWGQLGSGGLLSLQVFTPGVIADPLSNYLAAANGKSEPVAGLPDGKLYAIGLLPGGGGVGSTVVWRTGPGKAALSLAATDTTVAQQQALITAAQQAATKI